MRQSGTLKRASALTVALILLASAFTLSLASCGTSHGGSASGGNSGDGKLSVVTTIFPQYDFVRAIAKDRVELTMLISPGSESHTYEPSIADTAAVANADLFIYTGGDIDEWASSLAESVKDAGVLSISVMDAFDDAQNASRDGENASGKNAGGGIGEHVWTSPKLASEILEYIADVLCQLDPDGADVYRRNADAYKAELLSIGEEFSALSADADGKIVVVADRFPFDSMFSDYNIAHAEALGGCAVGEEASAAVIGQLIDIVTSKHVSHVFYIEFSDRKLADLISEATGCGQLLLHSCHNVSREDFDAGVTFVDLMERNIKNLREVLT